MRDGENPSQDLNSLGCGRVKLRAMILIRLNAVGIDHTGDENSLECVKGRSIDDSNSLECGRERSIDDSNSLECAKKGSGGRFGYARMREGEIER